MRAIHLFLLLGLSCGFAQAQSTPASASPAPASLSAVPAEAAPAGGSQQRTERILVEDGGSRIDELRVGGQTKSISVQNKTTAMPGYEVQAPNEARTRSNGNNGSETTTAPRVWNVMKF